MGQAWRYSRTIAEIIWANSFWSSFPSSETSHLNENKWLYGRNSPNRKTTYNSNMTSSRSSVAPLWPLNAAMKRNSLKSIMPSLLLSVKSNKDLWRKYDITMIECEDRLSFKVRLVRRAKLFHSINKCSFIEFTSWIFSNEFLSDERNNNSNVQGHLHSSYWMPQLDFY